MRALNTFQTVVSFAGTPNTNYYYGVAFDDTGNNSRGPIALDGISPIGNGVVGGTFRLLVLYNQQFQFQVFYRSIPSDQTTEQDITGATNLFNTGFAPQLSTTGKSLNVVINLDAQFTRELSAQIPKGTYVFPRAIGSQSIAANSLNINVVTTNVVLRADTQNGITKPVDALDPQALATFARIGISSNNTPPSLVDLIGDERLNVSDTYKTRSDPKYVDFSTIDITNVQIAITRATQ